MMMAFLHALPCGPYVQWCICWSGVLTGWLGAIRITTHRLAPHCLVAHKHGVVPLHNTASTVQQAQLSRSRERLSTRRPRVRNPHGVVFELIKIERIQIGTFGEMQALTCGQFRNQSYCSSVSSSSRNGRLSIATKRAVLRSGDSWPT